MLLPIGLSEGCTLRRAVARDEVIAVGDVDRPQGRLADALFEEQRTTFAPA
jgi:predicted homoserine dehydrogenase-like protein